MLCAELPDQASSYAAEGTCAHELCAFLAEQALGRSVKDPTENLDYYNAEMQSCAEGYASFVMEEYGSVRSACPDAEVLVEQRVDISRWVPGCYGTADCAILSDGTAVVIDFKYGTGVPVSAASGEFGGNPQLMCYGLGVLDMFGGIYDISAIKMVIYQPRRGSISEYTMSSGDLLRWAEEVLAPTAKLALEGGGRRKAGRHCRFCKAKAACREFAEGNYPAMKSTAKEDFKNVKGDYDYA